jgi:RimJ/RimL family protein N-acetyltransferase
MLNNINKLFAPEEHDLKIEKSDIHHMGVFAQKKIPKGTNIGLAFEKIDNTGNPDIDLKRTKLGRYVNHSSSPNLNLVKDDNSYFFITSRDIDKKEELFVDYHGFDWESKDPDINTTQIYLTDNKEAVNKMINWIERHEGRDVLERLKVNHSKTDLENFRVIAKGYNRIGLVGILDLKDDRKNLFYKKIDRKSAIMTVYISPFMRGNGYGIVAQKLLAEELVLDDVYVIVSKDNSPALRAYNKTDEFKEVPHNILERLKEKKVLDNLIKLKDDYTVFYYTVSNINNEEKLFKESVMYSEAPGDEEEGDDTTTDENTDTTEDTETTEEDNVQSEVGFNFDSEENVVEEPKDEEKKDDINSRRERYLEKVFNKMYDKYTVLVDNMTNLDVTKDKQVIIDSLIEEYQETLEMLMQYYSHTNDPVSVQYQTILEFRVLFMHINNKLHAFKEMVNDD